MFTALKRITKSQADVTDIRPARPTLMSTNLQKKFSQGVQYNLKIIIKGDKCSGKTSLFRRLQGKNLEEEYKPTEEIQVANVQWNYKNIDDVVKVEVWDVVDNKGRKIHFPFHVGKPVNASLDAEFLDVYRGTNGVILVMDVTKNWTFTYVQNEISKVPQNIPVLILGNRCDMGHHRNIPEDTVQYFIDSVQRPQNAAQIRYTESSMVNGFGLKYIYKFLSLPFLHLQRSVLMGRLDRNAEEINIALQEIDIFQTSEAGDYNKFASQLSLKRREKAEELGVSLESSNPRTPSMIFGLGCPINRYTPFRRTKQGQPTVEGCHMPKVDNCNSTKEVMTVEEFVPDEEQLDKFLWDPPSNDLAHTTHLDESDSDIQEDGNPLVAKFQEDVDPNEEFYRPPPISTFEEVQRNDKKFRSRETSLEHQREFDRGTDHFQPELAYDSFKSSAKAKRSDSTSKKHSKSIDEGVGGPDVGTKKNGKSEGGKNSEASDADPSNGSKSQRQHNKKLRKETRSSKKKKKENPNVFLLKE